MRRFLMSVLAVLALVAFGSLVGSARGSGHYSAHGRALDCSEPYGALCAETNDSIGYGGEYTGHDEPSLLFYSDKPGSGNSNLYHLRLPTEPMVPRQGP